jgi:hypothetical protein
MVPQKPSKSELATSSGEHIRYLPGPMAASMVVAGAAEVHNANGKIKSVRLVPQPLQRIGEPSDIRLNAAVLDAREARHWTCDLAASSAMHLQVSLHAAGPVSFTQALDATVAVSVLAGGQGSR